MEKNGERQLQRLNESETDRKCEREELYASVYSSIFVCLVDFKTTSREIRYLVDGTQDISLAILRAAHTDRSERP